MSDKLIIPFGIGEQDTTQSAYESLGYRICLCHTEPDSSGYLEVRLIVPCSINKEIINADGLDSIIISSIPNPSIVNFDGEDYEVIDGVFEFTLDLPGIYPVWVRSNEYEQRTYLINAS